MRKAVIIVFILLCRFSTTRGQEVNYFDSPFGGGIGYIPGWVVPNIDGLNSQIKLFGTPEIAKSGFFTSGGSGFFYLGFVKNVRIGGLWFGGSTKEKAFVNGFRKEAIYSLGTGAFSVEYSLPFVKDLGISVGALLGGGNQSLELYQSQMPADWDNLWREITTPTGSTKDISRTLKNNFFLISPTINVDIPMYRFISIRVGAGYMMKFGGTWKVDNDREIMNAPDNLTKDSFFFQTGIFLGFFSF